MSAENIEFRWPSQSAFVLVTAGATLSLNDFLAFPALAIGNGGGSFLLLYLVFLFALGMPLLMGEVMLGRMMKTDPVEGFQQLNQRFGTSVYWELLGILVLVAAFLVVVTTSVIGGWSLAYTLKSVAGVYTGLDAGQIDAEILSFSQDGEKLSLWLTLFTVIVVMIGAQRRRLVLQKLLPALVILMTVLLMLCLVFALNFAQIGTSVEAFLQADISGFSAETAVLALQRAFYTLALALGLGFAFGSYFDDGLPIGYSVGLIVIVDMLFTIGSALAISAFVFAAGLQIEMGDLFAFQILPLAFNSVAGGESLLSLIYMMFTLAALTTAVALLENPARYLMRRFNWSRTAAFSTLGFCIWFVGMLVILSFSHWRGEGFSLEVVFGDGLFRVIDNAGFQDVIVFLSSHFIQPLAALLLCFYVAWILPRSTSFEALHLRSTFCFEIWSYVMRYITPALLLVVILASFRLI